MEKAKHTPGPWYVETGEDCCFHGGNRVSIREPQHETTVAEVWFADNDADLADGRLIAAAPELLEAARLMVAAWGDADAEAPALALLYAAIAKATGQDGGAR